MQLKLVHILGSVVYAVWLAAQSEAAFAKPNSGSKAPSNLFDHENPWLEISLSEMNTPQISSIFRAAVRCATHFGNHHGCDSPEVWFQFKGRTVVDANTCPTLERDLLDVPIGFAFSGKKNRARVGKFRTEGTIIKMKMSNRVAVSFPEGFVPSPEDLSAVAKLQNYGSSFVYYGSDDEELGAWAKQLLESAIICSDS